MEAEKKSFTVIEIQRSYFGAERVLGVGEKDERTFSVNSDDDGTICVFMISRRMLRSRFMRWLKCLDVE